MRVVSTGMHVPSFMKTYCGEEGGGGRITVGGIALLFVVFSGCWTPPSPHSPGTYSSMVKASALILDLRSEYGENCSELLLKTVWLALMMAYNGMA